MKKKVVLFLTLQEKSLSKEEFVSHLEVIKETMVCYAEMVNLEISKTLVYSGTAISKKNVLKEIEKLTVGTTVLIPSKEVVEFADIISSFSLKDVFFHAAYSSEQKKVISKELLAIELFAELAYEEMVRKVSAI